MLLFALLKHFHYLLIQKFCLMKWLSLEQHLSIKKFYGHSEQAVHNQVYIAMIVYCLNVLAQIYTKSHRTFLQISRYLKASLWKPARIWVRKIKEKGVP